MTVTRVEIERGHNGHKETESAEFNTVEEAREWADVMRNDFGYRRVYIDGVEYSPKGAR